MAYRLPQEEMEGRIDCFGEFDRSDVICLSHCSLNFDCAAARDHYHDLMMNDESLETLGIAHSA